MIICETESDFMKYNTVLFDADGTLFDFHRSEYEALNDALRAFGIMPDDVITQTYSAINDSLWKMLERGEIEKQILLYHRFELLAERFGFSYDAKAMAKEYMDNLSRKGYLIDGAGELCRKLYGRVRMYIVTNGVEYIQKRRYAESGIAVYFSDAFISGVIGSEKPSRDYFDYVASHIPDFDIGKTLIVGDSLTSDIAGGIAYGLDTCWFNPKHKEKPSDMDITFVTDNYREIYRIITGESENF